MPHIGRKAKIDDPASTGGQLRQARINTPGRPSMDTLAERLGCSPNTLLKIELSRAEPTEEFIQQYMNALAAYAAEVAEKVAPAETTSAPEPEQQQPEEDPHHFVVTREAAWTTAEGQQPVPRPVPVGSHQHSFTGASSLALSIDGLLIVKSCDNCPVVWVSKRFNFQQKFRHFDEIRVFTEDDREDYEEQRGAREEYRSHNTWNGNGNGYNRNREPQRGRW